MNGVNLENRTIDKFDLASRLKARDQLYSRITNARQKNNFKNFRKLKINNRRTTTNSPNYQDVSLNSCFNDLRPKINTVFEKPVPNLNMTMYGQNMNMATKYSNSPGTAINSQRAKPRMNSSLENKVPIKFRLKPNNVFNNNFMVSNSIKVTPRSLNTKFANYINRFNS